MKSARYYAVLSDIHANYPALAAVTRKIGELRLPEDEVQYLVLGDLTGYGSVPGALDCLNWARQQAGVPQVIGNHDEWLVHPFSYETIRLEARISLLSQRAVLERPENQPTWDWFRERVGWLTERDLSGEETRSIHILRLPGGQAPRLALVCTHGGVRAARRTHYLYPWHRTNMRFALVDSAALSGCANTCLLHGHTHFPVFARLVDGQVCYETIELERPMPLTGSVAINPGSAGQPRDGDPRAAFVLIDSEQQSATFYRAGYDHNTLVDQLRLEGNTHSDLHPLTPFERQRIIRSLSPTGSLELDHQPPEAIWMEAYGRLIELIRTADGLQERLYYQSIYNWNAAHTCLVSKPREKPGP